MTFDELKELIENTGIEITDGSSDAAIEIEAAGQNRTILITDPTDGRDVITVYEDGTIAVSKGALMAGEEPNWTDYALAHEEHLEIFNHYSKELTKLRILGISK